LTVESSWDEGAKEDCRRTIRASGGAGFASQRAVDERATVEKVSPAARKMGAGVARSCRRAEVRRVEEEEDVRREREVRDRFEVKLLVVRRRRAADMCL
jgi:hypothetical protein